MNKLIMGAAAAVASVSFASPVLAVGFVPASRTFTANGTSAMTHGALVVPCNAAFSGSVNGSGGAVTISGVAFSSGHPACPALTLKTPMTLTATSLTSANIPLVELVQGTTTICKGPITVTWTNGNGSTTSSTITLSGATLPTAIVGQPDCTNVSLNLTVSDPAVIVQ